jgi:hypothetical protein
VGTRSRSKNERRAAGLRLQAPAPGPAPAPASSERREASSCSSSEPHSPCPVGLFNHKKTVLLFFPLAFLRCSEAPRCEVRTPCSQCIQHSATSGQWPVVRGRTATTTAPRCSLLQASKLLGAGPSTTTAAGSGGLLTEVVGAAAPALDASPSDKRMALECASWPWNAPAERPGGQTPSQARHLGPHPEPPPRPAGIWPSCQLLHSSFRH